MEKKILDKLHKCQITILDEIVRICNKYNLNYFLIGGTLLGAVRHKGFIPWDDDLDIAMPRKDYELFIKICKQELKEGYLLDSITTNTMYYLPFIKIRKKDTILETYNMEKYRGNKGIWVDIFPLDNAKKQESNLQHIQAKIVKRLNAPILQKVNILENSQSIFDKILGRFPITILINMQQLIMKINKNEASKFFTNLGSNYNYIKQTIPKEKYFPCIKLEFEGKLYNSPRDYDYVLKRIFNNYMQLPPKEKRITHNPIRIKFENEQEIVFKGGK